MARAAKLPSNAVCVCGGGGGRDKASNTFDIQSFIKITIFQFSLVLQTFWSRPWSCNLCFVLFLLGGGGGGGLPYFRIFAQYWQFFHSGMLPYFRIFAQYWEFFHSGMLPYFRIFAQYWEFFHSGMLSCGGLHIQPASAVIGTPMRTPGGGGGGGVGLSWEYVLRIPSVSKRRLNGAVCQNHRIKRVVLCRYRKGTLRTLRNVYGIGSPTVGTTSSSVRLHICAVTYMTEILLHVT